MIPLKWDISSLLPRESCIPVEVVGALPDAIEIDWGSNPGSLHYLLSCWA
jgi:hypothetical protein